MTVNGASQQGYMQNPDFRQVIYQALFPLGQYSVLRPQALALEILVETEVYSDMLRQGVTVLEYNVHFFLYCIGEYICSVQIRPCRSPRISLGQRHLQ